MKCSRFDGTFPFLLRVSVLTNVRVCSGQFKTEKHERSPSGSPGDWLGGTGFCSGVPGGFGAWCWFW